METYDFYISKIMFNLIAIFGLLTLVITGIYWGYTFKENEQYINVSTREIQLINIINKEITYNFEPNLNKKYGEEISPRIFNIVIIGVILSMLLIEIGYRNSCKYKYSKPFKQRFKEFIQRLQNDKLFLLFF